MIARENFKAIMACAPGPAAVVTTLAGDGRPYGLTMSAVCSVSLDPPLVLACFDAGSNTLSAMRGTGSFTVNYLRHGQEAVALAFASKSGSKFEGLSWALPEAGIGGPILHEHDAAYAACRVLDLIVAGDHVIAVGEVHEGDVCADHPALAYAQRQFFAAVSA